MKMRYTAIILIVLTSLMAYGCTREMRSGDDEAVRPWAFDSIPAVSGGDGGQLSGGGSEGIQGDGVIQVAGDTRPDEDTSIEALLDSGRAALVNGRTDTAIDYFAQVLDIDGNNTTALYNLGFIYRQLERFEEAIDYSQRAVDSDPERLYVHQNLGFAYYENGDIDQAIPEFEEELLNHREETSLTGIALKLSEIYLSQGLHDEAFNAAMHAVTLQPESANTHVALAKVHIRNGAYDQAIESVQTAITFDEESAALRIVLGDAYWIADRTDEARAAYLDAIELDPSVEDDIEPERLTESESTTGSDPLNEPM
jgi:tetratricopeptide (TPR) repeat protein